MPDLGRYAAEVLSAYAGTIFLLLVMVGGSIWKSKRVKQALAQVENRRGKSE